MFRASTAHSDRNSSEFRHPVRGSESASSAFRNDFGERLRIRLRIRLQSRERSGPKARGSERSQRSAHGPALPQLSTAFRSACQRGRRGCPQQPLTLAVVLANDGAPFAALNARPNAFGYAFSCAFRAAGASGPGAPHTARRGHNCPRRFPAHISPQGDVPRFNRSLWPEFFRIPARRLRAVVIGRCLRAASPRRLRRAGVREAWRATQASRACCRPEHATPARDPACPAAAPLNQPGASAGPDSGTRASPTHPDSVAPNPADAGGECSCTSGRRPSLLRGCT